MFSKIAKKLNWDRDFELWWDVARGSFKDPRDKAAYGQRSIFDKGDPLNVQLRWDKRIEGIKLVRKRDDKRFGRTVHQSILRAFIEIADEFYYETKGEETFLFNYKYIAERLKSLSITAYAEADESVRMKEIGPRWTKFLD